MQNFKIWALHMCELTHVGPMSLPDFLCLMSDFLVFFESEEENKMVDRVWNKFCICIPKQYICMN